MNDLIFILFNFSLFGMFLSALLASQKVRDRVADTWVYLSTIKSTTHEIVIACFSFLSAILLTNKAKVSKLKTFIIAYGASIIYIQSVNNSFNSDVFNSVSQLLDFLGAVLIGALTYWPIQYFGALLFIKLMDKFKSRHIVVISVYLIMFSVLFLLLTSILIPPLGLLFIAIGQIIPVIGLPISVYGYSLFHGGPFIVAVTAITGTPPFGFEISSVYFIALSIGSFLIAPLTALFGIIVFSNKYLISMLAFLMEHLAVTSARTMFYSSSILFQISTGLMQAIYFK